MRRDLEEELYVAELFAFYGGLLTERQFEISRLYYNEDQSLAEIADQLGITRQSVRDSLVASRRLLTDYEEKLRLKDKFDRIRTIVADCGEGEERAAMLRVQGILEE